MVYEKLSVSFDITKLQNQMYSIIEKFPAVYQTEMFGGWSVLSSTGDYKDGWHQGHMLLREKNMQSKEQLEKVFTESGNKKDTAFTLPTEICTDYLAEVIDKIKSLGLQPCRARLIKLTAGGSSAIHRDAPDWEYCVRLHIPIITNDQCLFKVENESAHLAADGSAYLLKVNRYHKVTNQGPSDRFHLVMNVKDTLGISQHHRYENS